MPGESNIELTINWRPKKKHQNQKQEEQKCTKKYKNMPNKQKKQNKIAGKRHKHNWLKKVGVDGQFEGLEGSGL